MQKKVILTLAGVGIVVSLFKIQSIHYHKQIDKLQSELADAQIQNKILQTDLQSCKQIEENFKAKSDKLVSELLAEFDRVNKNFKKGGK
jgi:multidrug resistance efflux pump